MPAVSEMSTDPEQKKSPSQRFKEWFSNLVEDPIGTLVESAVWLFMLAIGLSLLVMFARMGWNMVRNAWN
jgi:hypothetical protein